MNFEPIRKTNEPVVKILLNQEEVIAIRNFIGSTSQQGRESICSTKYDDSVIRSLFITLKTFSVCS